jgi:hypothetical protein
LKWSKLFKKLKKRYHAIGVDDILSVPDRVDRSKKFSDLSSRSPITPQPRREWYGPVRHYHQTGRIGPRVFSAQEGGPAQEAKGM